MEYSRKASDEGWKMLAVVAVVSLFLLVGTLVFDMGTLWRLIWSLLVIGLSVVGLIYAAVNIRSEKTFICQLTEREFIQDIPVASCGESFRVSLDTITKIECHDGGGEVPSDEWYIHTNSGRYRITSNYGNPASKFVEALQHRNPALEIIQT